MPTDAEKVLEATDQKAHFQRLSRLLVCGGVTLIREVFDFIHPPADLPTVLSKHTTKKNLQWLRTKKVLSQLEWDYLYHPGTRICGKSADFDISLLFKLLRHVPNVSKPIPPPATGWDNLPSVTDHSLGADLARLKFYRNSIYAHTQTMEMTNGHFDDLWREISEALLRIAGFISSAKRDEWEKVINKFWHDDLTPDAEQYVAELRTWCKEDKEIKDELEKLRNEMEQLKFQQEEMKIKQEQMKIKQEQMNARQEQMNARQEQMNAREEQMNIMQKQMFDIVIVVEKLIKEGQDAEMQSENVCLPIPPEQPQAEGAADATSGGELQTNQQNPSIFLKFWDTVCRIKKCINQVTEYLSNTLGLDIHGKKLGSLVITVSCSSLEVLEELWKDYSTGHLSEVIQETVVTADVLKELDLKEVKLKTIISEETYHAYKQLLITQRSVLGNENLQQLCAEETNTRETPSITASASDENEGLKIQEATSQVLGNENLQQLCAEEASTRETPSIVASARDENEGLKIQEATSQGFSCRYDERKLDLIVAIDQTAASPLNFEYMKTQLIHLVDVITVEYYDFRLAIVKYGNQEIFSPKFTRDIAEMKSHIQKLQSRLLSSRKYNGLADGLALVLNLADNAEVEDDSKCRKDANKICILLPFIYDRPMFPKDYIRENGHDVMEICGQLAEKGVSLSTVAMLPKPFFLPTVDQQLVEDFFSGISLKTGGQLLITSDMRHLCQIVMYAVKEDISIERLLGTVGDLLVEIGKREKELSFEDLTMELTAQLKRRSCRRDVTYVFDMAIRRQSKLAKKLALQSGMKSACDLLERAKEKPEELEETVERKVSSDDDKEITDEVSSRILHKTEKSLRRSKRSEKRNEKPVL